MLYIKNLLTYIKNYVILSTSKTFGGMQDERYKQTRKNHYKNFGGIPLGRDGTYGSGNRLFCGNTELGKILCGI